MGVPSRAMVGPSGVLDMSSAFLHLMEEPEQATQKGHKDQKQDHQRMGSDDPFDYRVCHQRARQNPCQERWHRGAAACHRVSLCCCRR